MAREKKRALVDERISPARAHEAANDAFDEIAREKLGINRTDLSCLDSIENQAPMNASRPAELSGLTTAAVPNGHRAEREAHRARSPPRDRIATAWIPARARDDEFPRGEPSHPRMPIPVPHEVAFAIRGPIARADLRGLCERVCAILAHAGTVVRCDVRGVGSDAVCVEALARLHLAARRRGCCVRLENASDELLCLVELMGLTDVLCADR